MSGVRANRIGSWAGATGARTATTVAARTARRCERMGGAILGAPRLGRGRSGRGGVIRRSRGLIFQLTASARRVQNGMTGSVTRGGAGGGVVRLRGGEVVGW